MSDDWEIVSSYGLDDAATDLASLGMHSAFSGEHTYTVRNKETGEHRKVLAHNEEEVGQKIEDGEFIDE